MERQGGQHKEKENIFLTNVACYMFFFNAYYLIKKALFFAHMKNVQYENIIYPQWPFFNTLHHVSFASPVGLVIHKLRWAQGS